MVQMLDCVYGVALRGDQQSLPSSLAVAAVSRKATNRGLKPFSIMTAYRMPLNRNSADVRKTGDQ